MHWRRMPSSGRLAGVAALTPRSLFNLIAAKARDDSAVIIALIVRGLAVVAGFAVTYLIGNSLGPEATGQFALVAQTAVFLSIVGLFGLDVSAVRHFSKSKATGMGIAIGSLAKLVGASFGFILLIAAAMWLGGNTVWGWLFGGVVPADFLLVLCVMLIGRAGAALFGAILRSQHAFTLGQIVPALVVPLVTAIALATGIVDTVRGALWATAAGGLLALTLGAVATFSRAGTDGNAIRVGMRPIFASSLPLWGVGVVQNIAAWYGLAVAAQMLGAADAGLYRAAIQIAAVLQIASMAIFSVYSAKISTAFHAQDRQAAGSFAARSMRLSALLAVPAGAVLIVGGKFILSQIGPEFAAAYPILVVLVIGQVVFACTGPCGMVLAMSGNEKTNLLISISTTALLLVVAPIAAHFAGLMGVAVAMASILPLRNFIAFIMVYRLEGIHVWSGRAKPLPTDEPA